MNGESWLANNQRDSNIRKRKHYENAEYYAKNPQPNYNAFGAIGAEFIDERGFEYIAPSASNWLALGAKRGALLQGQRVLWIRRPRKIRELEFPRTGQTLKLYDIGSRQSVYDPSLPSSPARPDHVATVRSIYVTPRAATGYLYVTF